MLLTQLYLRPCPPYLRQCSCFICKHIHLNSKAIPSKSHHHAIFKGGDISCLEVDIKSLIEYRLFWKFRKGMQSIYKRKYTVNGLRLQANVASAVLTLIELDCSTGLILNVNMYTKKSILNGFCVGVLLPLSEIIKATMGVRYFVTDPPWWP